MTFSITRIIYIYLVISAFAANTILASWWWPFGDDEKETNTNAEVVPDASHPRQKKYVPTAEEDGVSIAHLEKLARNGNSSAMLSLGKIYFEGRAGEKQDLKKAFAYFLKSAQMGNPQAMFNTGLCYDAGFGVDANMDEALRWYYEAADNGLPEAQANAANAAEQLGDYASAFRYLKMLAKRGNTAAMCKVANYLSTGLAGEIDLEQAASYLQEAALRGNSRAQVKLADCYANGLGVERNYYEMFDLLSLAAQDGDAEAQAKLGLCYQRGMGTHKNAEQAYAWFLISAEGKYAPALIYLGDCYREGYGIPRDTGRAFECYRQAADQGEAIGEFSLAAAYLYGTGTVKDMRQAEVWMRLAAEHNLSLAQTQMGIFMSGRYPEFPAKPEEAFQWFRKAAEQEDPEGMYQLGICYLEGFGVSTDRQQGMTWLAQAAKCGNRKAVERLAAEQHQQL